MSTPATTTIFDVLILGSGPAGLATATGLARQLHTVLVLSDSSSNHPYRNARSKHMHNVLGGWDHRDPADFRSASRKDLAARYSGTVNFRDGVDVVKVLIRGGGGEGEEDDAGSGSGKRRKTFVALDGQGNEYLGRKLMIASGIRDIMPEGKFPGFGELWGRGIFHCLFCHGFEERGCPSAGILATGLLASMPPQAVAGVTRMAGRLAEGVVTVYTNGEGNEEFVRGLRTELRNKGKFVINTEKVVGLAKDPEVPGEAGVLVRLGDGSVRKEGFLAHLPDFELNGTFAKDLGLELDPQGRIKVEAPMNKTSVPGVYAAGDVATMMASVPTAAFMGSIAAAGLAHELQGENDVEE